MTWGLRAGNPLRLNCNTRPAPIRPNPKSRHEAFVMDVLLK